MVFRYQQEYKKAKELCDENIITQYDFENYYFQQLHNNFSTKYNESSNSENFMENYNYDPNMLIPKEILPYFISFYHM